MHEDRAPQRHIPQLDGLRGLAACMVVVSHVSNQSNLWNDMLGNGGGIIGVMLFFVLSGYLMGLLYLDRPFTTINVRSYVVHRAARVLPLFYVTVLVALVLRQVGYSPYDIDDTLALLLLAKGSDVFWTIPVEIHFYVALAGIWALFARWPRATIAIALVIGAEILTIGFPVGMPLSLFYWAPFFLSGLAISCWLKAGASRPAFLSTSAISLPLMLLLFPRIAGAIIYGDPDALQSTMFDGWHRTFCLLATSGCLIAALSVPSIAAFFSLKPMRYLGRISYSLYLLHMPVVAALWSIAGLRQFPFLFLVAASTSTILVAAISYHLIEAPARHLINVRLSSRKRSIPAPTVHAETLR